MWDTTYNERINKEKDRDGHEPKRKTKIDNDDYESNSNDEEKSSTINDLTRFTTANEDQGSNEVPIKHSPEASLFITQSSFRTFGFRLLSI